MSKADDIFYKEFGAVLVALVLFTLIVFFAARAIGAHSFEKVQNSPRAVLERIQPFGQVRVGKPEQVVAVAAPAATATAAASGGKSGEQVYKSACTVCHAAGVAGAPKMGDKAAWEPRLAQGLDALVNSSLKGKGAMPPKGGNTSLSDAEVKSAVEYMLQKAGLMEASENAAAAPAAEATAAAPAAEATAAAPAAEATAAASAAEATAAVGQAGEAVYSKACIACHSTGVAGAPKVGDKAAWEPRLGQGLDALVSSSLKGKGAMPPKGGNMSLSEAEVKSAVQYMLEKSGLQPG